MILGFISCSNQNGEKTAPLVTPASQPPATPPAAASSPATVEKDHVEVKEKDTVRTEISIGQQGGSIKTKKGTGVSLDKNGIKVGSKDVKIDIKNDTNQ